MKVYSQPQAFNISLLFSAKQPQSFRAPGRKHFPTLIQPGDIKGIIHSHSNWSDGVNTIEEMARECIKQRI